MAVGKLYTRRATLHFYRFNVMLHVMQACLYVLFDPFTDQLRYIGQTNNPRDRLCHHRTARVKRNRRMVAWIAMLKSVGREPRLQVLCWGERAEILKKEAALIRVTPGTFNVRHSGAGWHLSQTDELESYAYVRPSLT